jgi:16S rRNA (guanine(1405)-N(7))-methyltransferase
MIHQILQKIKANKKYSSLADSVVKKEIKAYLKSNPNASADKQTIKEIRAKLHRNYASFQTKKKNKTNIYLEELKQNTLNKNTNNKLLSITVSTKERINDYKSLYKKIFSITNKPEIIIDLGCGLNPFSFPTMSLPKLTYYAYDIDEKDMKYLNKYFKIMKPAGLTGKAKILDATNIKKIKQFPKSDIVFMFKLLDLFDNKVSEQLIIQAIKTTKHIVASFPTKTITRKPMNHPKRKGFELMLARLNLKFKTIQTDNEIFYVIEK